MIHRARLARGAVVAALRLRSRHGRSADQPVCPIDLALDEGVDVRFEPLKSLEGMYAPDRSLIIIGSLRPRGRRAYTCAHELAHHVFGHGLRVDELLDAETETLSKDAAEYVANRFAAALLMPKLAVLHAFGVRRWDIASCDPVQVFTIAGLLGVGYSTLVGYLKGTLGTIGSVAAQRLRESSPKAIRGCILGRDSPSGLVVVDEFWSGRPVDVEEGDLLLIPAGASADEDIVEHAGEQLLRARAPGKTRLRRGDWGVELRVMRAGYTGLAKYRHLKEVDDDV